MLSAVEGPEVQQIDRWLPADEWYALVQETADALQTGIRIRDYAALHYAAMWLRGETR